MAKTVMAPWPVSTRRILLVFSKLETLK